MALEIAFPRYPTIHLHVFGSTDQWLDPSSSIAFHFVQMMHAMLRREMKMKASKKRINNCKVAAIGILIAQANNMYLRTPMTGRIGDVFGMTSLWCDVLITNDSFERMGAVFYMGFPVFPYIHLFSLTIINTNEIAKCNAVVFIPSEMDVYLYRLLQPKCQQTTSDSCLYTNAVTRV